MDHLLFKAAGLCMLCTMKACGEETLNLCTALTPHIFLPQLRGADWQFRLFKEHCSLFSWDVGFSHIYLARKAQLRVKNPAKFLHRV